MDLTELRKQLQTPPTKGRRRAILLSTGSFCPVHKGHLQNIDLAAKFLAEKHNVDSLVAYVSPSCDSYVSHKLGDECIPFEHRFQMVKLACDEHNSQKNVLKIIPDSWEGNQPNFVPFPSVLDHFYHIIHREFPGQHLMVLYIAGADHFNRCSLYKKRYYVGISRIGYQIKGDTNAERHTYICKDEKYSKYFSDISSTMMRNARAQGESFDHLTFAPVAEYLHNVINW